MLVEMGTQSYYLTLCTISTPLESLLRPTRSPQKLGLPTAPQGTMGLPTAPALWEALTLSYAHLVSQSHTQVFLINVLLSHTLTNSQLNVLGPSTSTFFNLAISNINPAGYWKIYPVPVLVEHAHVKEREHEKHVVQTAKSAMYLNPGTSLPRHACVVPAYLSTALYRYLPHEQDVTSHTVSSLVRPLKYCDASSRIRLKSTE